MCSPGQSDLAAIQMPISEMFILFTEDQKVSYYIYLLQRPNVHIEYEKKPTIEFDRKAQKVEINVIIIMQNVLGKNMLCKTFSPFEESRPTPSHPHC